MNTGDYCVSLGFRILVNQLDSWLWFWVCELTSIWDELGPCLDLLGYNLGLPSKFDLVEEKNEIKEGQRECVRVHFGSSKPRSHLGSLKSGLGLPLRFGLGKGKVEEKRKRKKEEVPTKKGGQ